MPYCPHCGDEIEVDAKFCYSCGKAINKNREDGPGKSVRTQVFHGEVRKCPACGADVPSFTAICPECGHEFNSGRVISAIQDFTEQLHEYDIRITSAPKEKSGWASWSMLAKVGWVFLNIYTLCIPLLIYSVKPKKFKAGSFAQQKASFIENYVFPNEREAVLEALLFIKAQFTTLVNSSLDGAAVFWGRVWSNKAAQLQQKAQIIMPTDTVAVQTSTDIAALERQFKTKVLMKKILIIVLVAVAFIIFMNLGSRGGA